MQTSTHTVTNIVINSPNTWNKGNIMLFGSPRLESNTGVVLPFIHGQKNVSLLTVCIQEYAANHETDESNSGVRPGSPGLHAAEVHKWCMNLLANTTICAESCEIKHWNFKALHNPALYIHCKFFLYIMTLYFN